jgi:hypothetical protein
LRVKLKPSACHPNAAATSCRAAHSLATAALGELRHSTMIMNAFQAYGIARCCAIVPDVQLDVSHKAGSQLARTSQGPFGSGLWDGLGSGLWDTIAFGTRQYWNYSAADPAGCYRLLRSAARCVSTVGTSLPPHSGTCHACQRWDSQVCSMATAPVLARLHRYGSDSLLLPNTPCCGMLSL